MTTVRETLVAARALIADFDHWCQREYATDDTGFPVFHTSPEASCFCAAGAIGKAAHVPTDDAGEWLENAVSRETQRRLTLAAAQIFQLQGGSFVSVNDGEVGIPDTADECGDDGALIAHANMLRVFDIAIADAEALS